MALQIKFRADGVVQSKCRARYWRIDSGMASQSSPDSIPFFAIILIFARLKDHKQIDMSTEIFFFPLVDIQVRKLLTGSGTRSEQTALSY